MSNSFDFIFEASLNFPQAMQAVLEYQLKAGDVYSRFVHALTQPSARPAKSRDAGVSFLSTLKVNEVHIPASLEACTPATLPLLPVEAFRDARVYAAGSHPPELFFQSSGTSTSVRSRHEVAYAQVYKQSIFAGMRRFYPIENMVVLGYTPGYNQNPNSSLIWMINALVEADSSGLSQFLPVGKPIDPNLLKRIENEERSVLLFGAAFGLADIAENHPVSLPEGSIIMETGGMKTYRREMSRDQLHHILAEGFALPEEAIHSEYGMTELLSQAYASGNQGFRCPPWMQVTIRNPFNPLEEVADGEEGLIGVIDLANWASCPFVLTGDRGVRHPDGSFEVLGRWSAYHLRGCNFLLEEDAP